MLVFSTIVTLAVNKVITIIISRHIGWNPSMVIALLANQDMTSNGDSFAGQSRYDVYAMPASPLIEFFLLSAVFCISLSQLTLKLFDEGIKYMLIRFVSVVSLKQEQN